MSSDRRPTLPVGHSSSSPLVVSDSDNTRHDSLPLPEDFDVGSKPSVDLEREQQEKRSSQKWRHTLGIILLLVTVVLWTASNFLASTIFADHTYTKPYLVTYINTSFFIIPLIPIFIGTLRRDPQQFVAWKDAVLSRKTRYYKLEEDNGENDGFLKPDQPVDRPRSPSERLSVEDEMGNSQILGRAGSILSNEDKLSLHDTAKLSLEFSILWFVANYFTAACLEYTTVASSTILTSTSSIWTLLFGAIIHVEGFTFKKLIGVLASLAGVVLISSIDLSGNNDENRGSFPHKSKGQLALGDFMAFFSAILYGVYAVLMKKRIKDESKVNMPLFFGLVGLFNVALLWPGLIILHLTGIERFQLPPTGRILAIVLVNSTSSLISDLCWAYAMLLTSPLVVTVGLSLTIPLSLIGQMVINGQHSSFVYWLGALVVFCSFIFINHESKEEEVAHAAMEPGILHEGASQA